MSKAKEVYEAITTKTTIKDVLDGLKDGCDIWNHMWLWDVFARDLEELLKVAMSGASKEVMRTFIKKTIDRLCPGERANVTFCTAILSFSFA